ncbi:hypothetical protein LAJ19_20575 (plasmid) [Deinococcus taeanensis]|uniref:hypothetical protein n=1 Tax=Deinococcus taeanensis TaxID=2737050 RepID=UPI001CDCAFA4|nr:hypothetical protein [Deinococcus taeanensis]UBV45206.1 hypothetical protein LAJ19_20575 [Deinococcus taeanensis]
MMQPLPHDLQRRWMAYLDLEQRGQRKNALTQLDAFITALCSEFTPWRAWAKHLAAHVADDHAEIPIRFPLFERVLFPVLFEGVIHGEPGCARWLGHFHQWIHGSPRLTLTMPAPLMTAEGLYKEAVRQDPHDLLALKQLIEHQARSLGYTLHELPVGVLYGQNGASAQQCSDLLRLLEEFEQNVMRCGQLETYIGLVENCAFHFTAYRDYLNANAAGMTYAAFLREIASAP